MTTSDSAERDRLVCLVEITMMTMPPETLTMDELRTIETVIRGAIDRAFRPVGNAINLADRRAARDAGKTWSDEQKRLCARSPASAGVVTRFIPTCDNVVTPPDC
jgi:hypothetical protein